MKILVLAALIAAVASGRLGSQNVDVESQGPWRVGTLYRYEVDSFTVARLWEGESSGTAFQAKFVVRVQAPGRLLARLENPHHAQVLEKLSEYQRLPEGLKYQPMDHLDQPFEIIVDGGRVVSLGLPSNLPLAQENLLKGLIGALQLDLTTYRHVRRDENGYDKELHQGMFKKMETDVTGDCETMYNVYPAIPEWRRELPNFRTEEDPIVITKTKNYGHCHHRVAYHFGVPQGSEWTGTSHWNHEEQLIRRATISRILAAKQGPIYKSETTSTVHMHPQMYGKDKAEVLSYVLLKLESYVKDDQPEWQRPESFRQVNSLLYSISQKQVRITDGSSSEEDNQVFGNDQFLPVNQGSEQGYRVRRSSKWPVNMAVDETKAASSSESSSNSDSASTFYNDDVPKNNEPAYAALYMMPQSRSEKKQNPINAQKIVQELAQLLQNPNNMPKSDFLAKFNILVRIIASMSSEQLTLTSRGIEVAKSSTNKVKADMWMIYRDAVAQAGTLPAFNQIKTWILTKKIQEEEAAQVVASLVNTLRYPTKELMMQFYGLAMSEEVREQKYLNSTALIAFARFVNMGQVNNETAHSYYPTHMYGRLSRRHDSFVYEQILPRLSELLKEAIQREDSIKAQVYIKTIGNLGHRAILNVFAPYLEGKIPTSVYLRMQMVKSLSILAHQKDNHVRAVLFSILRNIAEHYEVRVAAIETIFMARPTTLMMHAMARMTHDDPSVHVRAALKSSIEYAAELKNIHFLDLARSAQAVKFMVTKEKFGYYLSSKYLNTFTDDETDLGIMTAVSQIGSLDNLFPKGLKYSIKSKTTGWNKEDTISTSISSVQQLVYAIQEQMNKMTKQNVRSESQLKYSAEKVSEMLNIKREPKNPLEAALMVSIMGQDRYFAFSQQDIELLPALIGQFFSELTKGTEYHYTKVLNQQQVSIMFPVSMGMPFIFKYKTPTVVHFQSKVKGPVNLKERLVNVNGDIQFTFARTIEGSVGFMDTLTNQYASVGVDSKFQMHVPLKMQLEMKSGELKIQMEPVRADQDSTILHYSVWPYVTMQKKDSLTTIALDTNTKVISRENKIVNIDTRFGQSLGYQFQLQGYSYSSDYRQMERIMSQGLVTGISNIFYQRDTALTHFNLRYLGKQSQNNRITLTAFYDVLYNEKQPAQPLVAANIDDVTPQSDVRRKEMVKRVAAGINGVKVQVLDMSATFEGQQKHAFVLTAAIGDSKVDKKIQYALFAGRNSAQLGNAQVNAVGTVIKPVVTSLNFLEALQKEMKMSFESEIKYGQNSYIRVTGLTERTQKYAEHLKNDKRGKQCAEEIAKNNFFQYACHDMIVKAHAPDYIKASVSYKNLSPVLTSAAYKAIKFAEYLGYWKSEVNPMKVTPEGKFEIESRLAYWEDTMTLNMDSRYGELRFINVPIPKVSARALAIYTPISTPERVYNYFTRHQYQPFCSVDGTKIRTFSNRTYDYTLTRGWHVVMLDDGRRLGSNEQLVVLARRPSERQQEVYVSYKSEHGKDFELEIQPAAQPKGRPIVKVTSSAKKVLEGDLTIYWDDAEVKPLLQYYTQPDGVLMVIVHEVRLRLMYDGERLVVLTRENRNNVRGICGYMNFERRFDFITPNGFVDRPEHYAASFALKDGEIDPETLKLQEEAKKLAYSPKHQFTAILPADQQWRKSKDVSSEEDESVERVYRTRSLLKPTLDCQIQKQVQYFQDQHEICITLERLPSCQSHCKGEGLKIQETQVTCRPKLDQQFWMYRNQIQQGLNPQVSGPQVIRQFRVPTSCRA